MRFVRCEACGAKALLAASQCPQCSHPLDLRDDRGESVPLARCPKCDTYYPRQRGGCRWCGTKVEDPRVAPYAWTALGVVVVALGAWGASRLGVASTVRRAIGGGPALVAIEPTTALPPHGESAAATKAVAQLEPVDTATRRVLATTVSAGSTPRESTSRRVALSTVAPAPAPMVRTPQPVITPAPGTPRATTPPGDVNWVPATARTWVNVRLDASRESSIVGVINPDSRVQLGDSRLGWLRVRAAGVTGWVDRRLFAVDSTSHP